MVLEIGSSLCVFPFFTLKSGARHVYVLAENSIISSITKEIIKNNEFQDRITVITLKDNDNCLEMVHLPVDKVDIIISNWMGVLLFQDSLLNIVIKARDKWLVCDGYILPDKANIYIAAIKSSQIKERLRFWDDVYNIDMRIIKENMVKSVSIEKCSSQLVASSICLLHTIDLYEINANELNSYSFSCKYELKFERNEIIQGVIAWFDVYFEKLPCKVFFTSSPFNKMTLYKQCLFYFDDEEILFKGENLAGSFALRNFKAEENQNDINYPFIGIKISFHFTGKITNKQLIKLYKLK